MTAIDNNFPDPDLSGISVANGSNSGANRSNRNENGQGAEGLNSFRDTISSAAPPEQKPKKKGLFARFTSGVKSFFTKAKEKNNSSKNASTPTPSTPAPTPTATQPATEASSSNPPAARVSELPTPTEQPTPTESSISNALSPSYASKKMEELSKGIENILKSDKPNYHQLDLLLRQLFVRLGLYMLNNEHKINQDTLKMIEEDIKKIRGTYNTKWELTLGIAMGAINIASGLIGMGGGIAGLTGSVTKDFLSQLQSLTSGAKTFSDGLSPIQAMIKSATESKRVLYNWYKERHSGFKSNTDSSLQNTRSILASQKSQIMNSIDTLYQAMIRQGS